jgi:hypothetical protein
MWVDDGKLMDRPLVRDWIFWLWLGVSFVFVISGISQDYAGSAGNGFTAGAAFVDVVVRLGFTALLFLLIPALIRRAVRRSRSVR